METAKKESAVPGLTIRWMEEGDIPEVARFTSECAELEPDAVEGTSAEEMLRWFHSPLNTGHILLASMESDGASRLVGAGDYSHSPGSEHAWGWIHVHPDYRLRGIGNALYKALMDYIAENGLPLPVMTPNKNANLLIDFLERRGYELDRYFWDLQLPAEVEVREEPVLPEGFSVRTFVPGEDEELFMQVRNATFAEHYGSVQRTLEEMTAVTKEPDFRPEGLFFAFEGEKVAGFCFTAIHPEECERRGVGVGHINSLGTMPEYRGRGIGRALLVMGVEYLRMEVPVVELSVEGKNSNAIALYESVGFRDYKGWANLVRTSGEWRVASGEWRVTSD